MSGDPFLDALNAKAGNVATVPVGNGVVAGQNIPTSHNNPGNIRDPNTGGFRQFDSPDAGQNAQMDLLNSYLRRGYDTPLKIASRWAPKGDGANDPVAYANHVSAALGIGPNDKVTPDMLPAFAHAQAIQEGYTPANAPMAEAPNDPNDPFLHALNSATGQGNANIPEPVAGGSPQGTGANAAPNGGGPDPLHPGGGGQVPPQPQTTSGQNVADTALGLLGGVEHAGSQYVRAGDYILPTQKALTAGYNYLSGNPQGTDNPLARGLEWLSKNAGQSSNNPDSWYSKGGRLAGDIVGSLPAMETKAFAAPEVGASLLARALRSGGNSALQGGIVGGLTGDTGHEASNIALGALVGAPFGPAADMLAPGASKLIDALKPSASKLWQSIMPSAAIDAMPTAAKAVEAAFPADVKQGINQMVEQGKSVADIQAAYPEWIKPGNTDKVQAWINFRKQGGQGPVAFGGAEPAAGTPADSTITASDLNAAGSRRGIESTTQLPAQVQEHVDALVRQGVPKDQALAEASVRYVGGSPTVGQVTRDFSQNQAESAASKLPLPEGQALAEQKVANNAALHDTAQGTVGNYGGTPGEGDAAQQAATSLKAASDAERQGVSAKYKAAEQADPEALIEPNALYDLLNSPEARALPDNTPEGGLLATVRNAIDLGQAAHDSKIAPAGMSPTAIDNIAKMVNRKFGADGAVNHWAGEVSRATSKDLDQLDGMGKLWSDARAAHRDWATKYSDPKGVADLIRTVPGGKSLANDGNWRTVSNNLIGSSSDKALGQVVGQLNANGDQQALQTLKAEIVQRAYDAATGGRAPTAADAGGNPNFNPKAWESTLNKIGMGKLNALFSKDEIAHLAAISRAARVLQDIPGTVNASNTASHQVLTQALIDAAQNGKTGKGASLAITAGETLGHLATAPLHITGAGLVANGALAAGGTVARKAAAGAATRKASSALADALRKTMDPSAARSAANDDALAAQQAKLRQQLADELAKYGVGAGVSAKNTGGR